MGVSGRACCFNPLHCGAVVASHQARLVQPQLVISIPFIAGQWSLRKEKKEEWDHSCSHFNPLHCGAVVASRAPDCSTPAPRISIPFIAGQWSLRGALPALPPERRQISIPFIAGQWSLPLAWGTRVSTSKSNFNPLHCGAVVASRLGADLSEVRVNNFNPLHCGAVVASCGSRRGGSPRPNFNPLHCGAVVASPRTPRARRRRRRISIPFIAGQWSLPAVALVAAALAV